MVMIRLLRKLLILKLKPMKLGQQLVMTMKMVLQLLMVHKHMMKLGLK
jgi:hypothetical protein